MGRKRLPDTPFEVRVEALDDEGRGIAHHGETTLSVWDALPGETVMARYRFGRRYRGQAETLEVIEASPERVDPPCPSFGTCSACNLQHLAEASQLAFKQDRLLRELRNRGGVEPERTLPPLVADRWAYRRKARLSVRAVKGKGRVLVGFRERDGRFVTDMQGCHTLYPRIARALPALAELIDTLAARETIPQLEASCGDDEAVLVLRHLEPLEADDVAALEAFEVRQGLRLYLQPKGPDTVQPLTPGPSRLAYRLPDENLEFHFEPLDFVQVNQGLNQAMVAQAMDLLAPEAGDRLLDLFCGLGNFSLPLARRGGSVLGLEGAEGLVRRAEANAARNGLDNVRFAVADLYDSGAAGPFPRDRFDRVLLDPPRSGAGPVLERIAATGARRLLYVSCNPVTLAEDAGALEREHGFRLVTVGAMDMFPQTPHIEAMALFEKRDGA